MTKATEERQIAKLLKKELTSANLGSEEMQALLQKLPLVLREEISRHTGTMVYYYGDEVRKVQKAEEEAALRAIPAGFKPDQLNGVDVGCGERTVSRSLVTIDAHRGKWEMEHGADQSYLSSASLRAWADDLPFKSNSVDFVIALHILEHVHDPVDTVRQWVDVIKPGGGVGIVLPDWRYTWDSRNDHHPWGHRWNPTPAFFSRLYVMHWSDLCVLEQIDTYPYKLSFDAVLRKRGTFEPFDPKRIENMPTGSQLWEGGHFLHGED